MQEMSPTTTPVTPAPISPLNQVPHFSTWLAICIGVVAICLAIGGYMLGLHDGKLLVPPSPSPLSSPSSSPPPIVYQSPSPDIYQLPSPTGIPGGVACTMEAKICPDGSAVGRTGPNCEFQACPGAAL